MRARQPLPDTWLMTDERLGERLFEAISRLPPNRSGLVFRHYSLPRAERRALFRKVKHIARRRGLLLLLAGSWTEAKAWGADGSHGRGPARGLRSAPVHNLAEVRAAERSGADFLFLSPVHATASHPGAEPLGEAGFAALARRTRLPMIALGGMDEERAKSLAALGAYGWAAVDAWDQKRKAVPT